MVRLTAGKTYTTRQPDRDYAAIAANALDEISACRETIDRLRRVSDAIQTRILSGYAWLDENSTFHPQYERAQNLIGELQAQHSMTRWHLRDAEVAHMGHAVALYDALDHMTPNEQLAFTRAHGDISHIKRPHMESYWRFMENWHLMNPDQANTPPSFEPR